MCAPKQSGAFQRFARPSTHDQHQARNWSRPDKELKYFLFHNKRACNLGKLYFLPKNHKRFFNVHGRPVISNCETATEKTSEFVDSHVETVTHKNWSYIKDSGGFVYEHCTKNGVFH